MARYLLLTPILFEGKTSGRRGKPLSSACCFNLLSIHLPYRWQGIAPLRKLVLLFAEVVGIERKQALAVEGLLPRPTGGPSLQAVLNSRRGEYARLSGFLTSYRALEGYVRAYGKGLEVKHGPIYTLPRETYPYTKSLLIGVDVYLNGYSSPFYPLSVAILDRVKEEIKSARAVDEIERALIPSTGR